MDRLYGDRRRTTELAEQLLAGGELRRPLCKTGQLVAGDTAAAHRARPKRHNSDRATPPHPMPIVLTTHIVMPATLQPHHTDTTAVIGIALLHKANGLGHRALPLCVGHAQSREVPGASEMIQPDGEKKLSRRVQARRGGALPGYRGCDDHRDRC